MTDTFRLDDDEEYAISLEPSKLNIFGLRRAKSISNRFDDLMVVVYMPPHLKTGGSTLDEPAFSTNSKEAQDFVDAVKANSSGSEFGAPANWPTPGFGVSCENCKYWNILLFPMSTDPGYATDTTSRFDDESSLPEGIGAIIPGIYEGGYRVGLHHASEPPHSYPALPVALDGFPGTRRYAVVRALSAAQSAMSTPSSKKKHSQKPNEAIPPAELAARQRNARLALKAWMESGFVDKKDAKSTNDEYRYDFVVPVIRIENKRGDVVRDFEREGVQVTAISVVVPPDDSICPVPQLETSKPKDAIDFAIALGADDIVVTRSSVFGANIHTSLREMGIDDENKDRALRSGREVNNFSEGCQVFKSPNDFHVVLRLAQFYKRATCRARNDKCRVALRLTVFAMN